MIDYIHVQLSIWGKWSVANTAKGVGYSPVCPMFKDARFGGAYGSKPPAGVSIDSPENIQDTDEAVKRLSKEQKALCVEFYVLGGTGAEVAGRLGIAKRTLYDRIHSLHQSVLGHLNDVVAGCH